MCAILATLSASDKLDRPALDRVLFEDRTDILATPKVLGRRKLSAVSRARETAEGGVGVMAYPKVGARVLAASLFLSMVAFSVPPVGAAGPMFGTIQVSGPAWVASESTDWSRLSSTRPLVAGDRLRTGSDGYLLADLGAAGVVGLYGDAEVITSDAGNAPTIDVQKGKVAFHLSPKSNLRLQAKGAGIASDAMPADGYVEYGQDGVPVVVVEDGSLMVQMAGTDRHLARGEKLALESTAQAEPIQLAASNGEDEKKAAAAMPGSGGHTTYGGISGAGWTAIGGVLALTGGAVGLAASNDHQGGDRNGSDD
jgi:hypothetical protein